MLLTLFFSAVLVFIGSQVHKFLSALKKVGYTPGYRPPLAPFSLFGAVLPTTWWNPGLSWPWEWRKFAYFNHTHDVISIVPFLFGKPCYYTGSVDILKQLLQNDLKTYISKPPDIFTGFLIMGDNLVAANGDMWKRHRRIVAPAFSPKTYALVWAESIATYREMVTAQGWDQKSTVFVPEINPLTVRFTFILISRCGFGLPEPWIETSGTENELAFGQALATAATSIVLRLILPRWAYKLPIKRVQSIDRAWKTVLTSMRNFITAGKEEFADEGVSDDKGDIFSRLIRASGVNAKFKLDDQEIIGNTFALMLAGHETTAHVLAATLGYLAIHQDEQEKAYLEIEKAIPRDRDPALEDAANLGHLLACFQEALRIFPPGHVLPRAITEDIAIKISHPSEKTIVLKKGNDIVIDMIGVHHDPHIFPEPEKFRPSRWYGVADNDVSMFGFGPRACIGRKFSQTEALCFLCLFLREWRCDVVLQNGETRQQYEDRVMGKGLCEFTFGVGPVPITLFRRG